MQLNRCVGPQEVLDDGSGHSLLDGARLRKAITAYFGGLRMVECMNLELKKIISMENIANFTVELFPRSVLNIFFTYLTGSWMHQDWVYLSFWAMGLQWTGFYFCDHALFWICLIQLNALWRIWIFFNPMAACLFLQRRCEDFSSSMEPDPDGFRPFRLTLQRDPLISGLGYNSQWK